MALSQIVPMDSSRTPRVPHLRIIEGGKKESDMAAPSPAIAPLSGVKRLLLGSAIILSLLIGAGIGHLLSPSLEGMDTVTHTVEEGDTLWSLASTTPLGASEDSVEMIRQLNHMDNSLLRVGQRITLPSAQ